MKRNRNSTKDRRTCFDRNKYELHGRPYLNCYLCKVPMDAARDIWEAEHVVPHALDGDELLPVCVPCHKKKSAKDVKAIAKGKRVRDFNIGVKRSKVPMPGGKMSPWKRKMNGQWVKRDEDK